MTNFLSSKYGYNPGRYQGYSLDTPAYKILARLDWNINETNKLNFRFSRSHSKDSNAPSSSTSPFTTNALYLGGEGISAGKGNRTSNSAMFLKVRVIAKTATLPLLLQNGTQSGASSTTLYV